METNINLPTLLTQTGLTLQKEMLESITKGQNILFDFGNSLSLIKYEDGELEMLKGYEFRHSKHVILSAVLDHLFNAPKEGTVPAKKMVSQKAQANVYGTHQIDFRFDEEFSVYLPSSSGQDLFFPLAYTFADGTMEKNEKMPLITLDPQLIEARLREITRPQYFEKVVIPFLNGKPTDFKIPSTKPPWFYSWRGNLYAKLAKTLQHGDFVYIGRKEEVSVFGYEGKDIRKGYPTWSTFGISTKPILTFSNCYLNFISKYDAQKPKHTGAGSVNVAEYRTYDIPGFNGKPFVFPQISRSFDCKIHMAEYPDIVTGNIDEALAHFKTTDFNEFSDMIRQYAETMDFVHPSLEHKRSYKWFH